MTAVTLSRVTDWAALGERWRDFEARSDCSFFQSWTWVGCLAEQRFSDPVLLEATLENRVVDMALFNRRRGPTGRETLWLGESGVSEIDTIYVEYNGILAAGSTSADLCWPGACGPLVGRHSMATAVHTVRVGSC